MTPKKTIQPLSDDEAQARMNKLVGIITSEAQREINLTTSQSNEDIEELKKTLVAEPKQTIDEWVEHLRAFTERQTKIHCARLRRIAKLRILEAYGDIRESIKNEARERIRERINQKTAESDATFGQMLLQGVLRLMEFKVLVHTTKADMGRVGKHYASVTVKFKEMTGHDLKLITSRHPLKEHYFGRIVISDKASTTFVDMNLFANVDQVADEVFSYYASYQDKTTTPRHWGMEALIQRGLITMPRGPNITPQDRDKILSTMRGDPRTQAPVFQIKEETKKADHEQTVGFAPGVRTSDTDGAQKRRASSHQARMRKVTIAPEALGYGMRPSVSLMEPGSGGPFFGYRAQDTSADVIGSSNDLYNLDFPSTTDVSQNPSKITIRKMNLFDDVVPPPSDDKKSISADKEAPAEGPVRSVKQLSWEASDSQTTTSKQTSPRASENTETARKESSADDTRKPK